MQQTKPPEFQVANPNAWKNFTDSRVNRGHPKGVSKPSPNKNKRKNSA